MDFVVNYCSQDYLDKKHPGKGLKCKPKEEIIAVVPYIHISFAIWNSYFDINEYVNYPIKSRIKELYFELSRGTLLDNVLLISQNSVILQDNQIFNSL